MRRILPLLFLLILTACGPKVAVQSTPEGGDLEAMLADNWAVGPVVLDPHLLLDGVADIEYKEQGGTWLGSSEAYAALPFFAILERRPELQIASFAAVAANVPEADLEALVQPLARGAELTPAILWRIGEAMPETRYLVTSRLVDTRIETRSPDEQQWLLPDERHTDEPAAEINVGTAKVIRWAKVELQVLDLREGRSAWSGTVEGKREELYNWKNPIESPGVEVEREDGEPVRIDLEGSPLRSPSLESALKPAFEALAKELLPSLEQ